jgi:hypothetical protein
VLACAVSLELDTLVDELDDESDALVVVPAVQAVSATGPTTVTAISAAVVVRLRHCPISRVITGGLPHPLAALSCSCKLAVAASRSYPGRGCGQPERRL